MSKESEDQAHAMVEHLCYELEVSQNQSKRLSFILQEIINTSSANEESNYLAQHFKEIAQRGLIEYDSGLSKKLPESLSSVEKWINSQFPYVEDDCDQFKSFKMIQRETAREAVRFLINNCGYKVGWIKYGDGVIGASTRNNHPHQGVLIPKEVIKDGQN